MIILGIETSCDETAASIIKTNNDKITVLSNVVSSQIEIHKKYGGVVPEVAAREHVLNILPVVNEAFSIAGIKKEQASKKIDAIAVTIGPGLITSLMVGVETAKTLAYTWKIPLIGVNHIEGHIYANFINQKKEIKFPLVVLTVSGGHTLLVFMEKNGKFKIVGETRDDAAGEAFDKAAQLLGIGYPGGPAIAAKAAQVKSQKSTRLPDGQEVKKIILPRPMINSNNLDFSFSGLKTALLYQIQSDEIMKSKKSEVKNRRITEYAFEFQQAVIDVLVTKTIMAAKKFQAKTIMLSGGVAANAELRNNLSLNVGKQLPLTNLIISDLKYTTDNAAMIAASGYFRAKQKKYSRWDNLKANPNLILK